VFGVGRRLEASLHGWSRSRQSPRCDSLCYHPRPATPLSLQLGDFEDDLRAMEGHVRIERAGAVRTLVLDRPDKRNALNLGMLECLVDELSVAPSPAERVLVIRGEGKVFCAGLDLNELSKGRVGASVFERVLHKVENFPLPVVAVIHGDAFAGGCELALHCDFVIASEEARFAMPLAQFGLAPSWMLAKKLIEAAGTAGAREILLLGDPLPAVRMLALGAICRVAPAAELEGVMRGIVDTLSRNAPLSLRTIKATLVRQMSFRDNIAHEDIDRMIEQVRTSRDLAEGIKARLERRPPRFSGE